MMTAKQRKAQLALRGITLAQIRDACALDDKDKPGLSHISRVICGERRSKRIERAAAKLMGVTVTEAFG